MRVSRAHRRPATDRRAARRSLCAHPSPIRRLIPGTRPYATARSGVAGCAGQARPRSDSKKYAHLRRIAHTHPFSPLLSPVDRVCKVLGHQLGRPLQGDGVAGGNGLEGHDVWCALVSRSFSRSCVCVLAVARPVLFLNLLLSSLRVPDAVAHAPGRPASPHSTHSHDQHARRPPPVDGGPGASSVVAVCGGGRSLSSARALLPDLPPPHTTHTHPHPSPFPSSPTRLTSPPPPRSGP